MTHTPEALRAIRGTLRSLNLVEMANDLDAAIAALSATPPEAAKDSGALAAFDAWWERRHGEPK